MYTFSIYIISLGLLTSCSVEENQRTQASGRVIAVGTERRPDSVDDSNDNIDQGEFDNNPLSLSEIVADDDKLKQMVEAILANLRDQEPLITADEAFVNTLVEVIKDSGANTSEAITEAIYPTIQELFRNDTNLAGSELTTLVLDSPDLVKPQIIAEINEYVQSQSM